MSDYGRFDVQPLDALHDTQSHCCCDFESDEASHKAGVTRSCALVPQWSMSYKFVNIESSMVCPLVKLDAWPMTKSKAATMDLIGNHGESFHLKNTLHLKWDEDKGCDKLEKIVILTTDAYCTGYLSHVGKAPSTTCQ